MSINIIQNIKMEDGYYISLYVAVGEMAHLKGLFVKHDQNMALWKKSGERIELIRYWELERFTGIKQHNIAFFNVIHLKRICNELLSSLHLSLEDMVGIFGCPEIDTSNHYRESIPKNIAFHSLLHLYSGLFVDTRIFFDENILCLAVDGGPDSTLDNGISKKYHYCGMYVSHGKTDEPFHLISPGPLWNYMYEKFGLREGTLMALGSATTCKLLNAEYDAIYNIFNDYQLEKIYLSRINELFERVFKLTRKDEGKEFIDYDERFSLQENQISMIVKVIQQISINIMEYNVKCAIEKYEITPKNTTLCITGGYALNCSTNSYLMKKFGFKEFVAPPCVNDSGLSLGLGLYFFYKEMGYFKFSLNNSYHGEAFNVLSQEIREDFKDYIDSLEELNEAKIVEDIISYPIVWFDGNAEIGPRALGHRSLIGDPRNEKTQGILNEIKQREWWRPVAPIIMLKYLNEWFDNAIPSPYMLLTFQITKQKLLNVPAIKHLDYSARVQTIEESDNPRLYHVMEKFYEETGVPILCNTSLNDKEEPIINNISETFNFALRKNIPVIYVNGTRIKLKNHLQYNETSFLKRPISFYVYSSEDERRKMVSLCNPLKLSDMSLKWKYRYYSFKHYDITKTSDVKIMEKIIVKLNNKVEKLTKPE